MAAPALASTVGGPDAELLDLCRQWHRGQRRNDRVGRLRDDIEGRYLDIYRDNLDVCWKIIYADPDHAAADEALDAVVAERVRLWEDIGNMQAHTLPGLLAKAAVSESECIDGGIEEESRRFSDGCTPQSMALTVVRDMLKMIVNA